MRFAWNQLHALYSSPSAEFLSHYQLHQGEAESSPDCQDQIMCLRACVVEKSFLVLLSTYFLTPWCRVLPEQLTGLQLVKKFPAFHGTPRFITALTCVRHLSLSWANPIQSIYPHPTSWRSILILSTLLRLGLPVDSFPPVSPPRPCTPVWGVRGVWGVRWRSWLRQCATSWKVVGSIPDSVTGIFH